MNLTLGRVELYPELVTAKLMLDSGDPVILRPLLQEDSYLLADFLMQLSPETRRYSVFPAFDLATAEELCAAINRFDKLRLVVVTEEEDHLIALLEFSFGIPSGDLYRFAGYGIQLSETTDCRFGPCIADSYQNKGLGSQLMPEICKIAFGFGKKRIILWGGVYASNSRAIHFYKKHDFQSLGAFTGPDGRKSYDMIRFLGEAKSNPSFNGVIHGHK